MARLGHGRRPANVLIESWAKYAIALSGLATLYLDRTLQEFVLLLGISLFLSKYALCTNNCGASWQWEGETSNT